MDYDPVALDRYITGNYGEDQYSEDNDMEPIPAPQEPEVWYVLRVNMVGGGTFELCRVDSPGQAATVVQTLLEAWGTSERYIEVQTHVTRNPYE